MLSTEVAPVLLLNLFPRLHPVQLSALNKVTAVLSFSLSKAAPRERNCRTGKQVCEFLLEGKGSVLSPYGVHALAVGVNAVAAALAADGEVGVLGTKV